MSSQQDKFNLNEKMMHNGGGLYGSDGGHTSLQGDSGGAGGGGGGGGGGSGHGQAPSPSGSPCSSMSGKDSSGSSIGSLKELTYTGLTTVDLCADMQNR